MLTFESASVLGVNSIVEKLTVRPTSYDGIRFPRCIFSTNKHG